jgi:outer membrane protein assembly factor BamD
MTMCAVAQSPTPIGETPLPPIRHAERLTFDEQNNRWVRSPQPVPGTEDGDLDIVRQLAARAQYEDALEAVEEWIEQYGPDSPRYVEALYLKAATNLEAKEYKTAYDAYYALLNDFPGSPYAERSLSGLFRIAEQLLAGEKRKAWKGLIKIEDRDRGIEIMDDLILNYPDTPYAVLAQRAKADYYFTQGEFELAEDEYARFTRDYDRSRFQPYSLLQSARAALASFPGVQFDDASLVESQERFRQFAQQYPAQAEQLEVRVLLDEIGATRAEKTFEIAKFYERTKKYQAAGYYYRQTIQRWPDTPAALEAEGRLAGLPEPEDLLDTVYTGELPTATQPGEPTTQPGQVELFEAMEADETNRPAEDETEGTPVQPNGGTSNGQDQQ